MAYRLTWRGAAPLDARWGVQWNLALTAGDAFGRYFRLAERPSLGGRGARAGERELVMVDEWIGVGADARVRGARDCAWAPVETVSLSEAGLERIYQGSSILWWWPLAWREAKRVSSACRSRCGRSRRRERVFA